MVLDTKRCRRHSGSVVADTTGGAFASANPCAAALLRGVVSACCEHMLAVSCTASRLLVLLLVLLVLLLVLLPLLLLLTLWAALI